MFKIKYEYETGDSFSNEDAEGVLEISWKDKSKAQDAIRRIREHYQYYRAINGYHSYSEASEILKAIEEARKADWFAATLHDERGEYTLKVKTDEDKDYQFRAPWCGYFETLYGAEIIEDDPNNKVTFRGRY